MKCRTKLQEEFESLPEHVQNALDDYADRADEAVMSYSEVAVRSASRDLKNYLLESGMSLNLARLIHYSIGAGAIVNFENKKRAEIVQSN